MEKQHTYELSKPAPTSRPWTTYFWSLYREAGSPYGDNQQGMEQWRDETWETLRDLYGIPGVKIVWALDNSPEARENVQNAWVQTLNEQFGFS